MVTIYKEGTFEAAHKLANHPKCGYLHGHSYRYEVWLTGETQGNWGFVLDFHEIKLYFDKYDHSDDVIMISAERLVQDAAQHFFKMRDNIKKVKIRVWETKTAYAETELSY